MEPHGRKTAKNLQGKEWDRSSHFRSYLRCKVRCIRWIGKLIEKLEPTTRLELVTLGLRNRCSTN